MTLARSKRKRKPKNPAKVTSDITLNDFANSNNRAKAEVYRKKTGIKQLLEEVKSLAFDVESDPSEDLSDLQIPKHTRKRKTKNNEDSEGQEVTPITEDSEGVRPASIYPLYVWFIIGEYIRPEDVGRFASICTASRAVVSSPTFWLSLRRRYVSRAYGGDKNNYALRAHVIRTLKQSYEPLQARSQFFMRSPTLCMAQTGNLACSDNLLSNCPSLERYGAAKFQTAMVQRRRLRFLGDHHLVLGASCMQAWQEKRKDGWIYYIKLKHLTDVDGMPSQYSTSPGEDTEISEDNDETPECWMSIEEESLEYENEQKTQIEDVWANSEEGCKVIEIVLDKGQQLMNWHMGPPILGLSLVQACVRQASITSPRSRLLSLLFGPAYLSPRATSSLLSKLSTDWESCGGGWAESVSEAEEIALACGTPLPEGSECGVFRRRCCKGSCGIGAISTHRDGMVPVILPSVNGVRLLNWWDADYPYPGEMRN